MDLHGRMDQDSLLAEGALFSHMDHGRKEVGVSEEAVHVHTHPADLLVVADPSGNHGYSHHIVISVNVLADSPWESNLGEEDLDDRKCHLLLVVRNDGEGFEIGILRRWPEQGIHHSHQQCSGRWSL